MTFSGKPPSNILSPSSSVMREFWTMKKRLPFWPGVPPLSMATAPLKCQRLRLYSSSNGSPEALSPPLPLLSGSPVATWTLGTAL